MTEALNTTRFKTYYSLTKPGIIRGNILTAIGGFLLASKSDVSFGLLAATLAGIALIIACGCVLNNYIDRDIDKKMDRTKKRPTATGKVSGRQVALFAILLGVSGFYLLSKYTNTLTVLVGLIGLFSYVVLYGAAKRKSIYGTHVGSISGSMSIVAGYTAVTGRIEWADGRIGSITEDDRVRERWLIAPGLVDAHIHIVYYRDSLLFVIFF